MFEFILPDLGEGIHEAEILKWHVAEGDVIKEDDPLVDVETDKAAVTIPSPRGGTIQKLSGDVGDTVTVGQIIVVIDDGVPLKAAVPEVQEAAGGAATPAPVAAAKAPPAPAPAPAAPAASVSAAPAPAAAAPSPAAPAPASGRGGPVPAAPATRRLARELGVDLRAVPATGRGDRVTADDVRRFAEDGGAPIPASEPAPTPAGAPARKPRPPVEIPAGASLPLVDLEALPDFSEFGPVDIQPLRSIRRKVARKMATSSALVAQVSHVDEADVTELEALRRRERERRTGEPGGKLTLLAFVARAAVAGLREFPMFNASLDPFREELIYKQYYNVGIAADSSKGLVVPVIHDVDRKSVLQIAADIEDIAERSRDDKLTAADFRGGSFTISNIGSIGGFSPNPTVNYPEVAILLTGRAADKPVIQNGEIKIRRIMPLALSFDHRIADGAQAARFMNALKRRLADPSALLIET